MSQGYTIYPVGERAVTIDWGDIVDEKTNDRILGLFQWIQERKIPGVTDLVPAYQSLMVVYDPVYIRKQTATPSAYGWIRETLEEILSDQRDMPVLPSRALEIPVCYDASLAPDLIALSKDRSVPVDTLIALHAGRSYRVYMLGFLPGFPYMGRVDERIAAPRKREPVPLIPRGSVGIAGLQTGIYPMDSPGGWHIIGRCPLPLFDPEGPGPAYLRAGDTVTFIPITLEAFYGYTSY
jgi:inhibitor of KinA